MLKRKLGGIGYLNIASDRSIYPDKIYYSNLHSTYWYWKLGTLNGPDTTQKSMEMINKYNEKAGCELASFKINDKNQIIVAVIDELTKCVHKLVPQAGDQCFIDATGSLDQIDSYLYKLMCASPAGGLPLGFLVLSGKDENLVTEGS